jgi:hypothetical protein
MTTAVAFLLVGAIWLIFRRGIARQQHRIVMQMTGRSQQPNQGQIDAIQKIGVLFSVLLLLAGLIMLALHITFQR